MKLSIIMPLHNMSQWLKTSLDTIPVRDDVEVLMIENGSSDDTLQICEEYCNKNKNWKVIHFDEPIGCGQACNEGFDRAVGDYLLQLDGDDYLYQDVLNEILDNELCADLVYFNMIDNNNNIWILDKNNCANLPDHTSLIKRTFLSDTRMPILENDRFDIGHGWRMFKELLAKEHTSHFTNKIVYYYNFPRVGSVYWNATHK